MAATLFAFLSVEFAARVYYLTTYRDGLADLTANDNGPGPGSVATLGDILRPSADPEILLEMKPNLDVRFTGTSLRTNSRG